MAFQLVVAGVDKTAYLQVNPVPRFTRKQNERSTVEMSFKPGFLPGLYDDFIMNDGGTPIFRGVLVPHIRELDRGNMVVGVDATGYDYAFFFDRCFWSKTYTGSKTALQILTDLQSEKLAAYSITIDAGQDAGDTFVDFTVTDMKVSDVLRQLGSAHLVPRVYKVSPTRTLLLYEPGSVSAAFSVTDSAPSFYTMRWTYSDVVPANDVTILFGPNGLGDPITYQWIGDGSTRLFNLTGVSPQSSSVWPGYVTVNGVFTPLWPVGTGPTDSIEWDFATNSGELNFKGTTGPPGVGITILLTYTPILPFSVNATTGASPKLEARFADPSVPTFAVAQAMADSTLLKLNQAPREATIVTWQYCEPGQLLSVQNAKRSIPSPVDFTIADVKAEFTEFYSLGSRLWVYTIRATETVSYQGSYIDRARELFGGGSSGGSAIVSSGSGITTLPALPSGYIWVGDATNVAQAVVMSGDATISNTGIVTVTGGGTGMITLPNGQIYVGNVSNAAAAVAMTGDISITNTGVTAIGASKVTSAMIVDGTIVNADINASAAIVDTKLATIATALKVSNSATTATSANTANAIVARNGSGDFTANDVTVDELTANTIVHTPGVSWTTTMAISTVAASGGHLYLQPDGSVVVAPTGNYTLPGIGYTQNIGAINQKFLTLHAAELWVETLVAQNTMATIGGRILVAPTNILTRDLLASDSTGSYPTQTATIYVKYPTFRLQVVGVELGSKFYMEAQGKFEAFIVLDTVTPTVTGSGDYGYSVFRNQDNTGTNDWFAGDACLDTGKFNNGGAGADGFIDLYSLRGVVSTGYGPSIVGNVRTGPAYSDFEPRWAIGNLRNLYGYSTDTYGVALGVPTGAWVKIDPTNGVRIGHNATTSTQIDASGNASFTGAVTATSGSFTGSITAASGTIGGWVIDTDHIRDAGNSAGISSLVSGGDDIRFWAGASFASKGSAPFRVTEAGIIIAYSGSIAGWTLDPNVFIDPLDTCGIVSHNTGADDVRFYAGAALGSRFTAPFRVHKSGALVATSATITGDITATSGSFTGTVTAGAGAIGGWVVGTTYIRDAAGVVGLSSAVTGGNDIRIWAGHTTPSSAAFRVYEDGAVVMTSATISGDGSGMTNIDGANIQTGTVTAAKINVGTLDAISANLGTITAGTISGTTFYAGGTDVVLDTSGLTLANGGSTSNKIKWTDGSFIVAGSGQLSLVCSTLVFDSTDIVVVAMTGGGDRYLYVNNAGQIVAGASYP